MTAYGTIPVFNLFGETSDFPDVVHCERIWDRARLHDWLIAPHRHRDMAQVLFMEQGQAAVSVDGETLALTDNRFVFLPPLVVHGFRFRQGAEGLVLSFPRNVLAGLRASSDELDQRLSRPFSGAGDERLTVLTRMFAETFALHSGYRLQMLVALSHAILTTISEIDRAGAADHIDAVPQRMRDFQALILRNMAARWRPGDYASAMSITTGHLNRICHAYAGQSASRHIEAQVMTEARRLLAFTQLPVAEVAYRLGFDDPAHFSRRFRLACARTPSGYRAQFHQP
ncbi:helix-turn-helix domain-containing protein [Paracoccus laeviglucosivorans]|uniref:Transcriptional regulator, AraC family n=1 Tax=Paracoccus laeviglucosivorans TaxID=1197861 RepID=A0A521BIK2_9RHOB|nr:helix-turn-helix domain-containing protein [Paracoccus laeviglucosivorans]SMO46869.1 transcriptional regulator, AraC family [Paracoccus laeviglucosivorans]